MNARHDRTIEKSVMTFVLVTSAGRLGARSFDWLHEIGMVDTVPLEAELLPRRVATLNPGVVLLEFSPEQLTEAAEVVRVMRRVRPDLPVLGFGVAADPAITLAALRAGVDDFLDETMPREEAIQQLKAASQRGAAPGAPVKGQLAMVLGARPGLGVSTFAASLALVLQRQWAVGAAPTALLDLGLPAADGMLYLDVQGEFDFVEGVRNLKRFDQTLAQTALARHPSGVAVLPLPSNLSLMREISHAESVALVDRLRDFFSFQVVDLGGFSNHEFVAQLLRGSPDARIWVVCDQGIASIVSTSQMLAELREKGVEAKRIGLIVNRFDPQVGVLAEDIARRLEVQLDAVLPARSTQLLAASGRGEMLVEKERRDPYTIAVARLAQSLPLPTGLQAAGCGAGDQGGLSRLVPWLAQWKRRRDVERG